jgi:uncharacterized protein
MATGPAFYPRRAPIDAYGNGGFRFAEMSHRGSILILPSGIYAWNVANAGEIDADALASALAQAGTMRLLLVGTGPTQVFCLADLRSRFADAGIGLECMATGAAARTYNVLLAEGRDVGAALIAVE